MERRRAIKCLLATGAVAVVTTLGACSREGGYQRGIFTGYVVDATEEEIVGKIGKPDQVDASIRTRRAGSTTARRSTRTT